MASINGVQPDARAILPVTMWYTGPPAELSITDKQPRPNAYFTVTMDRF
ncbi:MAG: hypothetical protein V4508_00805 [Pseudomonadota bacterium]